MNQDFYCFNLEVKMPKSFSPEELDNMTHDKLVLYTGTEKSSIMFAQSIGLLPKVKICVCGSDTSLRFRVGERENCTSFRCVDRSCRKEMSIRKNTIFEKSHLKISIILRMMHKFVCDEVNFENIAQNFVIGSNHTIVDWLNLFRDVCLGHFLRNPILIGGPGHIVEIDECQLVRRKHNLGHIVRSCWILGGYDLETFECFFFKIENKREETLLPLILQHVREGSTIYTDCHLSYNNLQLYGYQHRTVNHSRNFVDPVSRACTNHIESMWQKLKGKSKERFGTHRSTLESHIYEFIWRKKFGKSFSKFIFDVKEEYNIN